MNHGESLPLTSLRISHGALKGDTLPERLKILAWGRNESVKGDVLFDEHSAAALRASQRRLGFDRVALDFEHNTVPGSDEYERTREPRDIAAQGSVEVVDDDGLYLANLTWTPAGKSHARNYEDLSAAVALDAESRVRFIHSAALTRNGAVYDLSFFSARAEAPKTTTPPMPESTLAPEIAALKTQVDDLTKRLTAFESKTPPPQADLTPLSARLDALEKKDSEREAAAEAKQRDDLVALASTQGKVIPLSADQIKITPLAVLRELVEKIAPTVPLAARGKSNDATKGPELKGLSRVAAAINAQLQGKE